MKAWVAHPLVAPPTNGSYWFSASPPSEQVRGGRRRKPPARSLVYTTVPSDLSEMLKSSDSLAESTKGCGIATWPWRARGINVAAAHALNGSARVYRRGTLHISKTKISNCQRRYGRWVSPAVAYSPNIPLKFSGQFGYFMLWVRANLSRRRLPLIRCV